MASAPDKVWLYMEALASALDCDCSTAEDNLNQLESGLRDLSSQDLDEVRRKMICIVAQLSRLEVRMMSDDGPLRRSNQKF